jgi:hypothetical protein
LNGSDLGTVTARRRKPFDRAGNLSHLPTADSAFAWQCGLRLCIIDGLNSFPVKRPFTMHLSRPSLICLTAFTSLTLLAAAASAEKLAYQWQAGQKFSYQVKIVVDSDAATTTYQGVIHYTVNNVNDAQSTVTYQGGLPESKKSKVANRGFGRPFGPRGFGPPSIPSPFSQPTFRGKTNTTNKITITPRGKTLAMQGDSQLPYLLGNVSLLPFEALPGNDTDKWIDDGGVSITEESENDRGRFGPFGRFGPMSPFDRGNDPESVQAAGEVASYQVTGSEGDLVTISKTYRLNTPPTKDNPSFDMTGNGTWTFDKKDNVPHAYDMKFKLVVKVDNTTTTVPISVTYNRLSAEAVAEMEAAKKKRAEEMAAAAAEQKRIAETPLTPAEKQQTLAALASADGNQIRAALDKLAAKSLPNPDPEIAAAIESHLTADDRGLAKSAHNAMSKWSPSYAKRKKLEKNYQGPSPVSSTGRVVESSTPLYVGQIVQAQRNNRGSFWFAAKVKQLLPDGKVELGFLTWGEERGRSTETVARNRIQLPPEEYVQPVDPPSTTAPTAAAATRTWTDATGRFTIDAVFVSVTGGKLTLRRADGKTMQIPVEKLSSDDQAHVKKLQAELETRQDNPFKLVK